MGRKEGPHAANTVAKRLCSLFAYGQRLGLMQHNPARHAERRKTGGDGYHTWTEAEIEKFLARHPEGTKARLGLLLILNTGAARQDVARPGWQNVAHGRMRYVGARRRWRQTCRSCPRWRPSCGTFPPTG